MNDRENRRQQMFGRVETFCTKIAADLPPGSKARTCAANLSQVIKDLNAAKAAQQGGDRTAREVLIDALRLDLQNVVRTARAIAQDEPGFAARFRLPDLPSQAALLTAADTIVTELKKTGVAAKFITHELPAEFVQHLVDDRTAIDAAQDAEENDDTEGVASTAAIGRLIKAGLKEVTSLNAIMHNKYTRDADKLRAWESASHTERAPQRAKPPAVAAAAPAAKPPGN